MVTTSVPGLLINLILRHIISLNSSTTGLSSVRPRLRVTTVKDRTSEPINLVLRQKNRHVCTMCQYSNFTFSVILRESCLEPYISLEFYGR